MQRSGFVDVSVTGKAVLRQHKADFPVFPFDKVSACAADCAFKWILQAVPVLLAAENEAGMAVRTESLVGISHPPALFHRRGSRLHDIFTHLMGSLELFRTEQDIARTAVSGCHHLVNDDYRLREHRRAHRFKSERLPVMTGASDRDQSRDCMRIFLYITDLKAEGQLVGKESLSELQIKGTRRQIIGRHADDHPGAGLHFIDDLIHIVLILQNAALIFLCRIHRHFAHLHRAAFTAGAVFDMIVKEVDHLTLRAFCLSGEKRFLDENFTVAAVTPCHNTEYLHKPFSFFCKRTRVLLLFDYTGRTLSISSK